MDLPGRADFRAYRGVPGPKALESKEKTDWRLAGLHDTTNLTAYRYCPNRVVRGRPACRDDRRTAGISSFAEIEIGKSLDKKRVVARAFETGSFH
jgi:hypothetical protein